MIKTGLTDLMPCPKQQGWPADCSRCEQWIGISGNCPGEYSEGKCPCEVMSKKHFDYLVKQAGEE